MSGDRATRRAQVAQLTAQGLPQRAIATRLGIGQGTVARDQKALTSSGAAGADIGASARVAARVLQAKDAMRQLEEAMRHLDEAYLPRVVVPTATVRAWADQLDLISDQLARIADELHDDLPAEPGQEARP